ncbi:MAG TPA: long-chain fatty acid--CoA ligase, partial [Zetaproteobacteria bacterium]|nr:long-chain fatty acid--CoA ligase [Zetaproteobacteria bacterium]
MAAQPHRPAQWLRSEEGYLPVTYEQFDARIRALACGLLRIGVKSGDRVAVLMENVPEWAVIDYAILSIGAVTVPMYCSYRPQDIAYVLQDSGAAVAITSGGNLLRHLLTAADEAGGVKKIYALDCGHTQDPRLHELAELQNPGDSASNEMAALDRRLATVRRESLATLVYTSGTTGNPKGVMLSHGNIMANLEVVPHVIQLKQGDMMLSFLPLAHALERTGGHFLPYSFGLSVAFAERPDTVAKNLAEARPTMLITVPRLLEVMQSRMLGQIAKQSPLARGLFGHFLALGKKSGTAPLSYFEQFRFNMLDRFVGRKVRERFGGHLRVLISGGAPLSPEVGSFFEALGLP